MAFKLQRIPFTYKLGRYHLVTPHEVNKNTQMGSDPESMYRSFGINFYLKYYSLIIHRDFGMKVSSEDWDTKFPYEGKINFGVSILVPNDIAFLIQPSDKSFEGVIYDQPGWTNIELRLSPNDNIREFVFRGGVLMFRVLPLLNTNYQFIYKQVANGQET